ncbi:MAG TPA: hypothetical protein VND64_26065 [Pirellulales bacterium]|nr:hypothetical protein [Pirellulales bacterium]
MIENDAQLDQAIEQLGRMYRAMAALRRDVLLASPSRFSLLAEGPLDEIERLEVEINSYTGATLAREQRAASFRS